MPWDKSIRIFGESLSPEINLTDAENFCRDPLNFGFLWCFIDSPYSSEEWEPCQHQGRVLIFFFSCLLLKL